MKLGLVLIVLIISTFYLTQVKSNYVVFPLVRGLIGYAIEYYIGKDKIKVDSSFDLVKSESYMSNRNYLRNENFPKNKYISEGVYTKENESFPFKVFTDVISFANGVNINDFQFTMFNITSPPFKDSISLSYASLDNKNSFINMLYTRGYISKKKVFYSKEEKTIYIGKVNIPQTNSSYSQGTCWISHKKWGCQFYSLTFQNKTIFSNNFYAIIDPTESSILFPKALFNQFKDTIFKKYLDNNNCTYTLFYSQYRFMCYCTVVYEISTLELNIGYNIFYLDGKQLFFDYEGFCIFSIIESENEHIVLGRDFMRDYSFELDYSSKKLTFISSKLNIKKNSQLYLRWYVLKTIIFILIFGISIIIINYNLLKNIIVI